MATRTNLEDIWKYCGLFGKKETKVSFGNVVMCHSTAKKKKGTNYERETRNSNEVSWYE